MLHGIPLVRDKDDTAQRNQKPPHPQQTLTNPLSPDTQPVLLIFAVGDATVPLSP